MPHPRQGNIISQFLDLVGDGSGVNNAVGTYGSPTDFKITPASDEIYVISRLIVSLEDTVGMDADAYGNGITLTNGIAVAVKDGSGVVDALTDPTHLIKTNGAWAHYCYDTELLEWGSGNEHLVVRWTFSKSGKPLVLRGHRGEFLAVTLNDTFTGLVGHHFLVQGYTESLPT